MKTVTEMRESASKTAGAIAGATKKMAYAVIGAPAVAKKRIASDKWRNSARKEFDSWVTEGERLTGQVKDAKVVEDIKEKVDVEQLQGRVEKLRDQLEDVLQSWKANFKPEKDEEKAEKKPAAKKAAAKAEKKPAAKKASAKAKDDKAADEDG